MRSGIWIGMAVGLVAACLCCFAQGQEVITYRLEGFEAFTPWVWCQQPLARGYAEAETGTVHEGKTAAGLVWDFSRAPRDYCFANFMLSRRMVGQVQEVRAWLYAGEAEIGAPLTLWVTDRSGETYIQRAKVEKAGWQQVSFRLAEVGPAWESGDRNRRQDPPLSLFGLAVEWGGPKTGRLVLDDVEVVTFATPREALALVPGTTMAKNLFWEHEPVLHLNVRNHSATTVEGVRCKLRVEDLYRGSEVWTGVVQYPAIPGDQEAKAEQRLPVPYGVYRVHWRLADGQGELLTGTLDVSRMVAKCGEGVPECVDEYDRRWSMFGGVFGSIAPDLARVMGARWIRYENTSWERYETGPGRFMMDGLVTGLRPYREAGIEPVILQTLYQRPSFRNPDQVDFAATYGEAMRRTAWVMTRGPDTSPPAAQGSRSPAPLWGGTYELGNEDNGPTKRLYTEVARHGAAGIRSVDPQALIANSGTAFVDLRWLKMQADRGLFDCLDVLCTHPYTVADSPEAWGIYERLGQVDELIDELGGMKVQWTTEFGWHHEFDQRKRAEWIPRHFLIGAAAGLEKHGLYTWERDYGIFQGTALPAAASVHALAKFIEGHRFVACCTKAMTTGPASGSVRASRW